MYVGNIYNNKSVIIDQVMYSYFEAPHSYTGEDVIEIYCHGNQIIVQEIFNELDKLNDLFYNIIQNECRHEYNCEWEFNEVSNDTNEYASGSSKKTKNDNKNVLASNLVESKKNGLNEENGTNSFIKIRQSFKGEFTKRAFENNKMDLLQLEGLRELLFCKQRIQKKIALSYTQGYARKVYVKMIKNIKELLMYIQFKIDFEDEHINESNEKNKINIFIQNKLNNIIKNIKTILKKKDTQNMNEPDNVLLFGFVNSGKSTLMNYICNKNISIVTNIKGTTIDIIQKNITIENNTYNLCDCAGVTLNTELDSSNNLLITKQNISKHNDTFCPTATNTHKILEHIGIKKTLNYLKHAVSVIVLSSINNYQQELQHIIYILNQNLKKKKKIPYIFICINKCDLAGTNTYDMIKKDIQKKISTGLYEHIFKKISKKFFFISSQKGYNVNNFLTYFNRTMENKKSILLKVGKHTTKGQYNIGSEQLEHHYFLPLERHKIYLKESLNHLLFVKKNSHYLDVDIIAEEIRLAIKPLNKIIGKITNEAILSKIFETFCIGK
uniref:GTPase n=1 Tax=Piliocolobus tephrosceles TaxID=591936 RepID=A0A8C9GH83_9PRIM